VVNRLTAVAFNTANNEVRFCAAAAGAAGTASASWPYVTRPSSGTANIAELWAFTADSTGLKCTTYTGDNTKANVLRWDWDNTGTMVAAPQFSMFGDTTHTAPSAGTQPPCSHNDPITNGHATDTSSTSYMKINAYGAFTTSNISAGSVGTNPAATAGGGGAKTCTASDWLNTHVAWNDAQGWINYIILNSTPTATTAGDWFWTCVLFTGVNMTTGTLTPNFTLQYTYS
jgi:hypothetical protein